MAVDQPFLGWEAMGMGSPTLGGLVGPLEPHVSGRGLADLLGTW